MRLSGIAAALMLAGCVHTINAPAFERAPSAPAGSANLYIYRHKAPPYIYRAEIYIDDRLAVKLPEGGYTVVPVEQGEHTVRIDSFDWPDVSFNVEVQDSSDIYLKFTGQANSLPITSVDRVAFNVIARIESVAEVYLVERAAAETELSSCCRFIRPPATAP